MNTTKLFVSSIVVALVIFLLNFIWYMYLFPGSMMAEGISKDPPDYMWLLIGHLVLGFLFTLIYPMMVGSESKVSEGLKYGTLIGLIVFLPAAFIGYATMDLGGMGVWIIDAIGNVVKFVIAGIVLAFVSGIPGGIPDRGPGKEPEVDND